MLRLPDVVHPGVARQHHLSDKQVWGRPVGVAVAKDGSLFVTEDGNGTIWRVRLSPADPGIGVAAGGRVHTALPHFFGASARAAAFTDRLLLLMAVKDGPSGPCNLDAAESVGPSRKKSGR